MNRIDTYLQQTTVGLSEEEGQAVQAEMRADLERLIDEGKLAGLSHDAAVDQALELFGCPRKICRHFQQVYLFPKLQQGGLMLACLMLLAMSWSSSAQWHPKPYCVQTNPECIETRDQWVPVERVLESFQRQGAQVTLSEVTSPTQPGVSNEVYRITLDGDVLELPGGPDRIHAAQYKDLALPLAESVKVDDGEIYIHKDALYTALMEGTSLPITMRPDAKTQSEIITIGSLALMFESVPVQDVAHDPFLMQHWRRLGVKLYQQTHHPVYIQSHSDNAVYTLQRHLEQGVYAVVYWYPGKDGLGFTVSRPDAENNASFALPLQPGREVKQLADLKRNGTDYIVLKLSEALVPLTYPE